MSKTEEIIVEKAACIGCVHPWILDWSGRCEDCRLEPLSKDLPEKQVAQPDEYPDIVLRAPPSSFAKFMNKGKKKRKDRSYTIMPRSSRFIRLLGAYDVRSASPDEVEGMYHLGSTHFEAFLPPYTGILPRAAGDGIGGYEAEGHNQRTSNLALLRLFLKYLAQ
jgi:hypothetical protein